MSNKERRLLKLTCGDPLSGLFYGLSFDILRSLFDILRFSSLVGMAHASMGHA